MSWINPLSYVLEGVAVNEFRGNQTVDINGQQVPGLVALQEIAGLPRYPFGQYGALDTPEKVRFLCSRQRQIADLVCVCSFHLLVLVQIIGQRLTRFCPRVDYPLCACRSSSSTSA